MTYVAVPALKPATVHGALVLKTLVIDYKQNKICLEGYHQLPKNIIMRLSCNLEKSDSGFFQKF